MVKNELHTKQRRVSKTKAIRESVPGRSRKKHEQMCRCKDPLRKLGKSRFHFESGHPEMKEEF